jgi:histidine ammonia-lyase
MRFMSTLHTDRDSVAVIIGEGPIDFSLICRILGRRLRVSLSPAAQKRLNRSRQALERLARGSDPIYGVNTGFGPLCRQRIPVDRLAELQRNLVVSHAVGVGPPTPADLVRLMMLFKIHSLALGHSGISPAVVDALVVMLNADALPVVPTRGSLGASGDLAPLAHLTLPLIDKGEILLNGKNVPAARAMADLGLSPVALGPKDGLALLNGTQFMSAYGAAIAARAGWLAKLADVIATMTLEAVRGSVRPFDERLIGLRPHPGAVECAANVRRLMEESEILPSHAGCDKVQDPYSVRCVAAVHGACRDALRHACETVLREINAVTDNPILIDGEAVSGGNFHGEPLALTFDYLALALTEWANISERRTYLLLNGTDGLPVMLISDTGINSGFMLPQYTAAALVSECKVLSHPASVDSIPTSLGQEDHVSMGAASVLKCWQVLDWAETVLAIELLCAAQALDYRLPLRAGRGPRAAHEAVRRHVAHAEQDRAYGDDIRTCLDLLRSGEILTAIEAAGCQLD